MALSTDLASAEQVAAWLAQRQEASDVVTGLLVDKLRGTLQRPLHPRAAPGSTAPHGLHRVLTKEAVAHDAVGGDGIAQGAMLYPEFERLTAKMWGGGAMEFVAPLRVGDEVRRVSRMTGFTEKTGKAGRLVFAQLENLFTVGGELRVRETETIAFREPAPLEAEGGETGAASAAPDLRNESWDFRREVQTDTVMLFQFSALTFNTHRIHYDQPYATQVEKYPGLLTHGPLTGLLLVDTCSAEVGSERLEAVSLRAQHPVFVGTKLTLTGRAAADGTVELAALDDRGRAAMLGTATVRS